MADWSDVRLIVIGPRAEVQRFHRHAKRKPLSPPEYVPDLIIDESGVHKPARRAARPHDIFTPDMLYGEAKAATATRMEALGKDLCRKKYFFDVRGDDGQEHFRRISKFYPALHFVLVYHWVSGQDHGSYLIRDGRSQSHITASGSGLLPDGDETLELMFAKHGYDYENADENDLENEERYYAATSELMDLSEAHWTRRVYRSLGVTAPPSQS